MGIYINQAGNCAARATTLFKIFNTASDPCPPFHQSPILGLRRPDFSPYKSRANNRGQGRRFEEFWGIEYLWKKSLSQKPKLRNNI